jgi:hypothetical protein
MGIHHDILGYLGGNTNNKPSIWGLLMDKNHDFGMFFFVYLTRGDIVEEYLSFFSSGSDDSTIDVYGKRHHPPIAEVFLGW